MVPIIHIICGKTAFYYAHRPINGELMLAKYMQNTDGTNASEFADMHCCSCGRRILAINHLRIGAPSEEDYNPYLEVSSEDGSNR